MMGAPSAPASLNLDARSLDALRTEAARNPKAAARQAAVQFESLFMQMVVKSMREATPRAEGPNPTLDNFTGMLDSQFAKQFAGRQGGLADMIEKQLTRHMQNLPAVSPENVARAEALQAMQVQQAQAAQAALAARAQAQVPPAGASSRTASAVAATGPAAGPSAASVPSTVSLAASGPVAALRNAGSRAAEFVRNMLPHAQEAERQTGVPASFILGQAALESGWGKGEIRNRDGSTSFNLFGIKATGGWDGKVANVMTTEYEGGQAVKQRDNFRSYNSYTEAFADYARLLTNSPRYSGVVRNADTPEEFAMGLQRAGYATDPRYAQKLERTIERTLELQRTLG